MKKLPLLYIAVFAVLGLFFISPPTAAAASADLKGDAQCQAQGDVKCITPCPDPAIAGATTSSQPGCPTTACSKDSQANCDIVKLYVNPLIKNLGIAVGVAVTIGIIWGGIEYSSSGGDPQKTASGKKHITIAIMALVGYFFIYALIHFLMPAGT